MKYGTVISTLKINGKWLDISFKQVGKDEWIGTEAITKISVSGESLGWALNSLKKAMQILADEYLTKQKPKPAPAKKSNVLRPSFGGNEKANA